MKKIIIFLFIIFSAPAYADGPLIGSCSLMANPFLTGDTTSGLCSSASATVSVEVSGNVKATWGTTGLGIGTSSPAATLDVQGGLALKRHAVADANYAVTSSDYLIAMTSITAARTITLLCTAGSVTDPQFFEFMDESGSVGSINTVTFTPASGTISGAANKSVNTAYAKFSWYSNGTNCFQLYP